MLAMLSFGWMVVRKCMDLSLPSGSWMEMLAAAGRLSSAIPGERTVPVCPCGTSRPVSLATIHGLLPILDLVGVLQAKPR